jgi:hypothetical protein
MRAVLLHAFGPTDVLMPAEVPAPRPGPGQVAIDVEFASVTFVDTQIRAGAPPNPAMAPALPPFRATGSAGSSRRSARTWTPRWWGGAGARGHGGTARPDCAHARAATGGGALAALVGSEPAGQATNRRPS